MSARPSGRRVALAALSAAAALALLTAPLAEAEFGVKAGTYSATLASTEAGAHGDFTLHYELNSHIDSVVGKVPDEVDKTLEAELPPGLLGNAQAYPKCSSEFLQAHKFCPPETQIGVLEYELSANAEGHLFAPLYNMFPHNGHPAEFGFENFFTGEHELHILTKLRPGDHGATSYVPAGPGRLQPITVTSYIWGVPAAAVHDPLRGIPLGGGCLTMEGASVCSLSSTAPEKPFLANPTQCTAAVQTGLTIDSYENPGEFLHYEAIPQLMEGCNQEDFEPTIQSKPTTDAGDSPSGLEFHLHIPQNEDPDGRAAAHLKDALVILPEGLTVNPASANGLGACSPAEIGLQTAVGDPKAVFDGNPNHCPDASKIGTVRVDTPLLDHPVQGSVYLATQNQNPFASLLAIYIALEDPETGVIVKIPSKIEADPVTGQLTATAPETPQLPFEDMHLEFFKGAAAPLKTPLACGTYATATDLVPWSSPEGADAFPSDSFAVVHGAGGGACVGSEAQAPNSPSFSAGTADPVGGAYSPFVLRLARADGTQQLSGIDTTLPKGLIGRLAGSSYCPEAALAAAAAKSGRSEQASPSCPASSKVGSVNVAAGAGPTPYNAQGQAYLAGPYKSAPLSLAVITPALAGPFDLGTVLVRTALHVDPETTQIHAVSDPFPSIIQGIPLDIRSLTVNLDRNRFTKNPTSCDPFQILGAATALSGQSAALSNPFQVGDCAKLGFKPKLSLKLKGGTKRGDNPALRATLTMPEGGANIARASVALPHSEFLAQAHIRTICTRVQFAANACPKGSVYGHARAWSPLLDQPLEGPVYLRSSSNPLPDLVADLDGQIHVTLAGRIDSVRGGIRNTFEIVPDAPVSKFVLTMAGGGKGLLENSRDICTAANKATVLFDAQNGKTADSRPALVAKGCGGKGKKHHQHSGHGRR